MIGKSRSDSRMPRPTDVPAIHSQSSRMGANGLPVFEGIATARNHTAAEIRIDITAPAINPLRMGCEELLRLIVVVSITRVDNLCLLSQSPSTQGTRASNAFCLSIQQLPVTRSDRERQIVANNDSAVFLGWQNVSG